MTGIFLSYSRKDDAQAARVASALADAGYTVTYDLSGIGGGPNWRQEVRRLIGEAVWFMPLVTPNYVDDHLARIELFTSLEQKTTLLPLLMTPTDYTILQHLKYVDFTHDFEAGIQEVMRYLTAQTEVDKVQNLGAELRWFSEELSRTMQQDNDDDLLPDRIFIAYSRKQRSIAKAIFELLVINNKAVFWDAKIRAGSAWRQTIQRALDDATHVIVIWTPDAAASDEVDREVSYALAEHKVVVPILSKEIPKLPYHLHGLHYIVLEDDVQSLATDLLRALAQFSKDDDIWQ